ncbi:MAG: sugar transferase [Pseudomonadota bacterium]
MMSTFEKTVKRCLDSAVSFSVLCCAAPVLLGIALAIRSTMGSPVLFRQQRPGFNGRPFYLNKFRTMRHPRPGEENAACDGLRITRLGKFLRSTSLDELPALLNVLTGEMSLVGPRPLLMQYLDRFTPEQARRHEVKPGITGWAQVNGRNTITWEEKFSFDVWYADHQSLWLDLRILGMTAGKVLKREGISHGSEATMPEFMGSKAAPERSRSSHSWPVQAGQKEKARR